jgi:mannose-6-phosphate isomerase-like protein (cupin superfamily)
MAKVHPAAKDGATVWVRPFRVEGKISPPDARSLSSSCVRLAPGARVGEHTTEGKEELLLVLEGEASLIVGTGTTKVPAGHAAYVPPETHHDVANEGRNPLVYVYITATLAGER